MAAAVVVVVAVVARKKPVATILWLRLVDSSSWMLQVLEGKRSWRLRRGQHLNGLLPHHDYDEDAAADELVDEKRERGWVGLASLASEEKRRERGL